MQLASKGSPVVQNVGLPQSSAPATVTDNTKVQKVAPVPVSSTLPGAQADAQKPARPNVSGNYTSLSLLFVLTWTVKVWTIDYCQQIICISNLLPFCLQICLSLGRLHFTDSSRRERTGKSHEIVLCTQSFYFCVNQCCYSLFVLQSQCKDAVSNFSRGNTSEEGT